MNTSNIFKLSFASLAFGLLLSSCKKEDYINNANQDAALFTKTSDNYFIENVAGDSYTGTIGVSRAVTTDTKIEFTVSSPTGAIIRMFSCNALSLLTSKIMGKKKDPVIKIKKPTQIQKLMVCDKGILVTVLTFS